MIVPLIYDVILKFMEKFRFFHVIVLPKFTHVNYSGDSYSQL